MEEFSEVGEQNVSHPFRIRVSVEEAGIPGASDLVHEVLEFTSDFMSTYRNVPLPEQPKTRNRTILRFLSQHHLPMHIQEIFFIAILRVVCVRIKKVPIIAIDNQPAGVARVLGVVPKEGVGKVVEKDNIKKSETHLYASSGRCILPPAISMLPSGPDREGVVTTV